VRDVEKAVRTIPPAHQWGSGGGQGTEGRAHRVNWQARTQGRRDGGELAKINHFFSGNDSLAVTKQKGDEKNGVRMGACD